MQLQQQVAKSERAKNTTVCGKKCKFVINTYKTNGKNVNAQSMQHPAAKM